MNEFSQKRRGKAIEFTFNSVIGVIPLTVGQLIDTFCPRSELLARHFKKVGFDYL